MSIEFTFVPGADGVAASNVGSFFFDLEATRKQLARAKEAGFESVIVDDAGGLLTNFDIAPHVARIAPSLRIVLTHWAGVMAPVVAARQIAALDTKIGGRLALRILADGDSGFENGRTPDAGHVATWQRTDEYLMLLKRLWSNDKPFDFEGAFHSIRNGFIAEKGGRDGPVPIRMSGRSGTALQVAGRHADVFELSPGTPAEIRWHIDRVRNAASLCGRSANIRFALPIAIAPDASVTPSAPRGYPTGAAASTAVALLAYVEAGVSEFMVSGIQDAAAIRLFGDHVAALLRNTIDRKEAEKAGELFPSGHAAMHHLSRHGHWPLREGRP